jgi:SSS family solute:Na+ symporter
LSSTASLLHLQGVAFGKDILLQHQKQGDQHTKPLIQIGTGLGLVLAVILAFIMPANVIARATVFWFGLCAICWLPVFTGALFWKGGTKEGALASVYTGLIFTLFWYLFVKASEAIPLGICLALTGKEVLFGHPFRSMDPLVFGIPLTTLVFVTVSLVSAKKGRIAEENSSNAA